MPIWTPDLMWQRLLAAATAKTSPRDAGDAEVLAWPALYVTDTDQLSILYSALYARVHGNDLETVARQRHGISLKTFTRRRKDACASICKGLNAVKWSHLQDCIGCDEPCPA